jgi:hypothetical protein
MYIHTYIQDSLKIVNAEKYEQLYILTAFAIRYITEIR